MHRKRGIKAMEENDIIPRYMGKLIHDCWASYFSYSNCGHGLCGSHLLRELTFVVETNRYRWARRMKRLRRISGYLSLHFLSFHSTSREHPPANNVDEMT
ncbi:MAG: transposase [Ferrovum myxofaciens]